MHDSVASRMTNILPTWCFVGRADGNPLQDGLISHLIGGIVMYILTDEVITQVTTRHVAFLAASAAHWPGVTAWCFVYGD